jgi:hypothetical protein
VERYDHHCPWINNCVGIRNHRDFMIFLTSTVVSILGAFVGCLVEFIQIAKADAIEDLTLNYFILPEHWYNSKALFNVFVWLIILLTGFFLFPILLLFYIQGKNFFANRTTNERYSRKKAPAAQGGRTERLSAASDVSRDSTGSSLLSVMHQLKAAEDILNEFGGPEDFEGRSCKCIIHQYAMFCNRTPPSQSKIYHELI